MLASEPHDVIIVGSGPAGSVLAARLSEDPARSVLLIEAGPDYGPDWRAWPPELNDPSFIWPESHPWGYTSPRPGGGEPVALPRGRVLGGSATINGCAWLRGSRVDYDAWASRGNPGWGFDDLLPAFRKAERDPLATGSGVHGADGPVPVYRVCKEELTPVERAFGTTAEALGFDHIADLNGSTDQRTGVGPTPKNIADGLRMHPALTYLDSARSRPNLHLLAETHVDRVVFDGRRAIGVVTSDGRLFDGKESILSAGAYGSPAILLRSALDRLSTCPSLESRWCKTCPVSAST